MRTPQVKLGITLFLFGLAGIFSLLPTNLMENLLSPEQLEIVLNTFSVTQLKWLSLINPTILLIISVLLGSGLYKTVNLKVPTLESWFTTQPTAPSFQEQLKSGITGGLLAGCLLVGISSLFYPSLPPEFLEFSKKLELPLITRFLYGGITEEILTRFGWMTLFVWLGYKITRQQSPGIYWAGILLAALTFAAGHLPAISMFLDGNSPVLIIYILVGNSIGGIIFGWLYWKKGLEAAIVAHMMTHVVMVLGEGIFN